MRYAGALEGPMSNVDTFTLYEGEWFRADEFYGVTNYTSLKYMAGKGSSLIITGLSPWTFYS